MNRENPLSSNSTLDYQLGIMRSEINALNKSEEEQKKKFEKTEKRISNLESWKGGIMAVSAAGVVAAGAIWTGVVFLKDIILSR